MWWKRLGLPEPCVNARKGVHGGLRVGGEGALVQAEPALQVNGPAGGIYRVLAQSELRSAYLHSDDFFFPFVKWEVSL